jgi:nucleotide-binding universal stress UspA family protein
MTGPGDPLGATAAPAPRIVVGVDGSATALRALEWAAGEARLHGAELEVVHVDFYRHEVMEALAPGLLRVEESVLDRATARARALAPGVPVTGRICDPPAGQALIEVSRGALMLVVGSRGLSGLQKIALGSVSTDCVQGARCPVVVVHPAEAGLLPLAGSHGAEDPVPTDEPAAVAGAADGCG